MSVRRKSLLAVVGGLLAALLLLVLLFDWNWLKRPIEALVEDQLGRDIQIAGDLDAEFSLTPRIVAHDVTLANAEWGTEPDMLQVDRLSFVLDVRTLIGGRLDVSDISLEGADVLVERSAEGEINWQLEREEDEEALAPIIGEFQIENAAIRYRDPGLEQELQLALTSAEGTGGRATEALQVQGEGAFADLPLQLALDAGSLNRLQAGEEPYPIDLELVAGDNALRLAGTVTTPENLRAAELNLQLSGPDLTPVLAAVEITDEPAPPISASARLVHEREVWALLDLDLEVGGSLLTGNLGFDTSEEPTFVKARLDSDGLSIEELILFLGTVLPTEPAVEGPPLFTREGLNLEALPHLRADIELDARAVEITPDAVLDRLRLDAELDERIPRLGLAGEGGLRGELVAFDVELGSGAAPNGAYPVQATLQVGQNRVELAGHTARPLDVAALQVELDVQSPEPSALLELAGLPGANLPGLELAGRLTREGEQWEITDLAARAGESDLAGDLRAALDRPEPMIQADVASNELYYNDIEALIDAVQQLGDAQLTGPGRPLISWVNGHPRLHPEALPEVQVDLTYTAGRLEGPELALEDVAAELHLHEGLPVVALAARGTALGEQVEIEVALGTADEDEGGYPIEARITAEQTRLALSGLIERPTELEGIDLQFEIVSPAPTRWLALAQLPAPELPAIRAAGQLIQESQSWQVSDLYLEAADSNLFGEVAVDLGPARPFIRADLQSNRLIVDELRQLVPAEAEGEPENGAAARGGMPGGLDLATLPEVDLDLDLQADHVRAEDLRLEPLTAQLRVRERVLVLDLAGEGWFHDTPITVQAQLGTDEALDDPDAPYPVQVALVTDQTELHAEGSVGEPIDFTGLQVEVSLQGESLEELGDILRLGLPSTPPYRLSTSLQHENDRWALPDLDGRIGDSDIGGEVILDTSGERLMVSADLRSDRLDFADVGGVVGEPPDPEAPLEEDDAALPEEEVPVPDLRGLDLQLQYAARNVIARRVPVDQVQIEARLQDGLLHIAPLGFELGVGVFTGELTLDNRQDPMEASADLRLHGADAEYIFDILEIELPDAEGPIAVGRLDARTRLAARGNSVAEMAETLDGQLAGIVEGGWVTAVLVQQLGMNLLEILGFFAPDPEEMEPVRCFVASFDVSGGVMGVEALVLDTETSLITGAGEIDLGGERIDLALQSNPKEVEFPVLAPTPVQITGSFGEIEVGPEGGAVAEQFLQALGLGVVLPVVGAAIPFIEPGLAEDSNCAWLIEQAEAGAPVPN